MATRPWNDPETEGLWREWMTGVGDMTKALTAVTLLGPTRIDGVAHERDQGWAGRVGRAQGLPTHPSGSGQRVAEPTAEPAPHQRPGGLARRSPLAAGLGERRKARPFGRRRRARSGYGGRADRTHRARPRGARPIPVRLR